MSEHHPAPPVLEANVEVTEVVAPIIQLDRPRVLTLSFSGFKYTWSFRRIVEPDWKKFFQSMTTQATYIGGESVETFEVDTALTELAMDTVESVDGYRMDESVKTRFRALLPPRHAHSFGLALRDVAPCRTPDTEPAELSDLLRVRIDCSWTDAADGKGTLRFSGLEHWLQHPTMQQLRAYNRKINTTRVIGGGRNGTTIYPVRQVAMMELYDELVMRVDPAYHAFGKPLIEEKSAIAREMDGCHKVAAIQAMLANASPEGAAIAGA